MEKEKMSMATLFEKCLEWFAKSPKRWIQGTAGSIESESCCSYGIMMCLSWDADRAGDIFERANRIERDENGYGGVVTWNDNPKRKYPQILKAFEKARDYAKKHNL